MFVFWKVLQHFPKFYSSLKKQPPHIRRISPIIYRDNQNTENVSYLGDSFIYPITWYLIYQWKFFSQLIRMLIAQWAIKSHYS